MLCEYCNLPNYLPSSDSVGAGVGAGGGAWWRWRWWWKSLVLGRFLGIARYDLDMKQYLIEGLLRECLKEDQIVVTHGNVVVDLVFRAECLPFSLDLRVNTDTCFFFMMIPYVLFL